MPKFQTYTAENGKKVSDKCECGEKMDLHDKRGYKWLQCSECGEQKYLDEEA